MLLSGMVAGAVLTSAAPSQADDAEDRAVARVKERGGLVTRDEKRPGKPVVEVILGFSKTSDADLRRLAPLTDLSRLYLHETQVTDTGLKELAPLKNLTTLVLIATPVTDAGLKHLAPLTKLMELDLAVTKVTNAGLEHLAPLKNLTTLDLSGTKVTDVGVAKLQRALPKCKVTR
jgi:Leucine-rich repeat (LRR) protein